MLHHHLGHSNGIIDNKPFFTYLNYFKRVQVEGTSSTLGPPHGNRKIHVDKVNLYPKVLTQA